MVATSLGRRSWHPGSARIMRTAAWMTCIAACATWVGVVSTPHGGTSVYEVGMRWPQSRAAMLTTYIHMGGVELVEPRALVAVAASSSRAPPSRCNRCTLLQHGRTTGRHPRVVFLQLSFGGQVYFFGAPEPLHRAKCMQQPRQRPRHAAQWLQPKTLNLVCLCCDT